jgi:hypothetical protein
MDPIQEARRQIENVVGSLFGEARKLPARSERRKLILKVASGLMRLCRRLAGVEKLPVTEKEGTPGRLDFSRRK